MDALFAVDDPPSSPHVTVVEEISEHVISEGLSLDAVAEIEAHPQQYPGVQLLHSFHREYRQRTLAAHSVGFWAQRTPTKAPRSRQSKGKLQPRSISKIEWAAPDRNGNMKSNCRLRG